MKTVKYVQTSAVGLIMFCMMNIIGLDQKVQAQEVKKGNSNKPDIRVKVNKEYDDKGNITRYDSTYSYSWSDTGSNSIAADSIFGKFSDFSRLEQDSDLYHSFFFDDNQLKRFPEHHPKQGFESKSDSIEYPEFFNDFFEHHHVFQDPFFNDSSFISIDKGFEDMMMENRKLMEYFFNRNGLKHHHKFEVPKRDSIHQAPPVKQNEMLDKQRNSSTIWI